MYGNEPSLQEMKENFRRQTVNISRQDISCVSRNIFEACLQSRGQHLETVLLKHVSWNVVEILTIFPADAGFVREKALAAAAVLREII